MATSYGEKVKRRREDVVGRSCCLLPSSLRADGDVADAEAWRGSFIQCCKQSKPPLNIQLQHLTNFFPGVLLATTLTQLVLE